MKKMKLIILIGLLFIIGCKQTPQKEDSFKSLLKAVYTNDQELFKSTYSEGIRESETQNDWSKNFKEAKANVIKLFGETYSLQDFKFSDEGNKVGIYFKGQLMFKIAVKKELKGWKLDER